MKYWADLPEKEVQQFVRAHRSKSQAKLTANDLLKLKKPLFNDYLLHLKHYAGSNPTQNKQSSTSYKPAKQQAEQQLKRLSQLKAGKKRDNIISHYYCEKNQLLSLKEFIVLMEESRKRTDRDQKINQRIIQKRIAEELSKNIQDSSTNFVDLRLTSNYAKKYHDKHMQFRNRLAAKQPQPQIQQSNIWGNKSLKPKMSQSHANFRVSKTKF